MRSTSSLRAGFSWLTPLKTDHLKDIARATGIRSAGPKPALLQRLNQELPQTEYLTAPPGLGRPVDHETELLLSSSLEQCQVGSSSGHGAISAKTRDLSILSIDMGIQNLAFAHLLVPSFAGNKHPPTPGPLPTATLNAWDRITVSTLPTNLPPSASLVSLLAVAKSQKPNSQTSSASTEDSPSLCIDEGSLSTEDNGSFALEEYASHAYTLITSLIATYKPTHFLIERQRFRSGGGSAVQEWTLRVGVFEGMLHAVLHTLGRERGQLFSIHGVEPKRVANYWMVDGADPGVAKPPVTQANRRISSREGKKAKIDIVGRWLAAWNDRGDSPPRYLGSGLLRLHVGPEAELRSRANAYLRKWQDSKGRRGARNSTNAGKLDDLADCLLQGVTWLEWQAMRGKFFREGLHALSWRNNDPNKVAEHCEMGNEAQAFLKQRRLRIRA